MSQQRARFLSQHWTPYPPAPGEGWLCGRLGAEISSLQLQGAKLLGLPTELQEQMFSVLHSGDLIALSEGKVLLLAPCLNPDVHHVQTDFTLQIKWSEYLHVVRQFFLQKSFHEAQTPTLTVCPGTEPFLDVFEVQLNSGARSEKRYLPTSPELSLKKLLVRGLKQVFEMRPCFRNNEIGPHHEPEFWMLEWYRAFSNADAIQKDLQQLILHLSRHFALSTDIQFHSQSVAELFQKYLEFNLQPNTSCEELKTLCEKHKISIHKTDLWDDLFYRLFLEKIEPFLKTEEPLFVYDYPPSQAAYARVNEKGWGERFEMYWQGLEVCNAFHELNDPVIQRQRFEEDFEKKRKTGRDLFPLDTEFLAHLEMGMPPSGGIAVGLERLFMALFKIQDIQTIKFFPY